MSAVSFITKSQRYAFFRACSVACQNLGLDTQLERDAYRKRIMKEETGKDHLTQLNRTTDFDKCMTRFAQDAGDWQTASKFASGDAYRLAVMIRICCQQVMQLKGYPDGSDAATNYLRGILERSQIACGTYVNDSSFWMDISKDSVLTVFQILDTHRRRLLAGYQSMRGMKGFDPQIVYAIHGDRITLTFSPRYYDSYNSIKVNVRAS